jgi:serine/threonine-protein kinase HipA
MAKPDSHRQNIEVHLDAADLGVQQRIGTMHRPLARTDLPASFEYDPEWLRSERAFMLDPRLELWTGEQHPPAKTAAFGIFMDSSPDAGGAC